jgi:hypothetical protein
VLATEYFTFNPFSFTVLHNALLCIDCHRGSDRRPLIRLPNIVCFFPKCCLDLFSHDVSVTYSPRDDPTSNGLIKTPPHAPAGSLTPLVGAETQKTPGQKLKNAGQRVAKVVTNGVGLVRAGAAAGLKAVGQASRAVGRGFGQGSIALDKGMVSL